VSDSANHQIAIDAISVPGLLTYGDVQDALQVSYRTLRRAVVAGELGVVLVGKHSPRFKPGDVLAFIERHTR
jgi:hypothetical protein